MAKIINSGNDINVKLIGSLDRQSFVDIAATITRSEKDLDEIIAMEYSAELVKKVVGMSHLATTEFDYFVFAVEGVSRVLEAQLLRKRHAAYMIKSGRVSKKGRRSFDIVRPKTLENCYCTVNVNPNIGLVNDSVNLGRIIGTDSTLELDLTFDNLVDILEQWYNNGVKQGFPEEDLRYIKPQGTEFKGLIAMNAHALLDWFKIRMCKNAQHEIRTLAMNMYKLVVEQAPDLFVNAGASCKALCYCPENEFQHKDCIGHIPTHKDIKLMIKNNYGKNN